MKWISLLLIICMGSQAVAASAPQASSPPYDRPGFELDLRAYLAGYPDPSNLVLTQARMQRIHRYLISQDRAEYIRSLLWIEEFKDSDAEAVFYLARSLENAWELDHDLFKLSESHTEAIRTSAQLGAFVALQATLGIALSIRRARPDLVGQSFKTLRVFWRLSGPALLAGAAVGARAHDPIQEWSQKFGQGLPPPAVVMHLGVADNPAQDTRDAMREIVATSATVMASDLAFAGLQWVRALQIFDAVTLPAKWTNLLVLAISVIIGLTVERGVEHYLEQKSYHDLLTAMKLDQIQLLQAVHNHDQWATLVAARSLRGDALILNAFLERKSAPKEQELAKEVDQPKKVRKTLQSLAKLGVRLSDPDVDSYLQGTLKQEQKDALISELMLSHGTQDPNRVLLLALVSLDHTQEPLVRSFKDELRLELQFRAQQRELILSQVGP